MQYLEIPKYEDILKARTTIRDYIKPTTMSRSVFLKEMTGINTHLKLENLNISGSFKIRGAANCIINKSQNDLKNGIVAASAGNHAQGVSRICRFFQIPNTIFMPEGSPLVKVARTKMLGAKVNLVGKTWDQSFKASQDHMERTGALYIHPFADPHIIAGQGTISLEVFDQLKEIDLIVVPIGGGGLISGIAIAAKKINPNIRIIGVQSEVFPSMKNAFDNVSGLPKSAEVVQTIAEGIAVKKANPFMLQIVNQFVDEIITVSEDEIAASIMFLMEWEHLLAEGAGAASVAALIKLSKLDPNLFKNKNAVCIISGGNIDINLLGHVKDRGLIETGRLVELKLVLPDHPGALGQLLNLIGNENANVREVDHDYDIKTIPLKHVQVTLKLETLDFDHQKQIIEVLNECKYKIL